MARAAAQPLLFAGPARRLSAALPESWIDAGELPQLELDAPEAQHAEVLIVTQPGGLGRGLRIEMPSSTPPGTYKGAVRLGTQKRPVVVEVPPNAHLRLLPNEITLSGVTGDETRASIVAVNRGNVEIDLPQSPQLRFFESPGLDREPGRVFEVRVPGLDPVFARTDELHLSAAAPAQVVLRDGAGPLAPGDERTFEIAVHVDPSATPGLRYFGEWSLAGETFALIFDVDPVAPPAQEAS
jgi:hypothetical protein